MFMTPPKTIYRQQQPTRLGILFQTPSVNGLGHSAYSTLSLVTTPSQLVELCPLFQLTRVTFDPALPYMRNGKRYSRKFSPKNSYVDKNDIYKNVPIGAQAQKSEAGQISGQLHCYV